MPIVVDRQGFARFGTLASSREHSKPTVESVICFVLQSTAFSILLKQAAELHTHDPRSAISQLLVTPSHNSHTAACRLETRSERAQLAHDPVERRAGLTV
jgi:hypothetical protein